MDSPAQQRRRRALTMLSLILAGESIFIPPFHLGRYFRSSMLSTFGIDEFELGQLGAVYGMLAMASYILGGPLADRFHARKLLSVSLLVTGAGSAFMATIPSLSTLYVLYGFYGVATILVFWAPLIRATRSWGGSEQQGRAFGILDGGRGLAAAVIATVAAHAFGLMVGTADDDPGRQATAIRLMLVGYAACCAGAAACVWMFVPEHARPADDASKDASGSGALSRLLTVVRLPAVWLHSLVIVAAYSAFKMFDNYGLYAEDAYGLSAADSATLIAYMSFLRVAAALGAGFVADRWLGVAPSIQLCFALLVASYAGFAFVPPDASLAWFLVANMAVGSLAFFALRGIYFALLEECSIPAAVTGTAVGVVSFIGFTPEIFMPPLIGWLVREPRAAGNVLVGYDQSHLVLIALSATGFLAAWTLHRMNKRPAA